MSKSEKHFQYLKGSFIQKNAMLYEIMVESVMSHGLF